MEFAILLAVVIFSLVAGFFLGILFLNTETPLAKSLQNSSREKGEPEPAPEASETPPAVESAEKDPPLSEPEAASRKPEQPTPGSQLILEVWLENEKELQYISFGRTYRRDQLPEPLLKILQMESTGRTGTSRSPESPPVESSPIQLLDEEIPQKKKVKLLSVIQEIDKILQEKLENSPLGNKGIQLMENQHQEIRIWVGLQSYDAVEEVPDPEVRTLILEAVEEWESKAG